MGLRGGEDSKRSDCDGEAEDVAAESVVAAGMLLAEAEILLEAVRVVADGAADIDGTDDNGTMDASYDTRNFLSSLPSSLRKTRAAALWRIVL